MHAVASVSFRQRYQLSAVLGSSQAYGGGPTGGERSSLFKRTPSPGPTTKKGRLEDRDLYPVFFPPLMMYKRFQETGGRTPRDGQTDSLRDAKYLNYSIIRSDELVFFLALVMFYSIFRFVNCKNLFFSWLVIAMNLGADGPAELTTTAPCQDIIFLHK